MLKEFIAETRLNIKRRYKQRRELLDVRDSFVAAMEEFRLNTSIISFLCDLDCR
jgi:hypothetical protein